MNNDAQIHSVDGRVAISDMHFALQIGWLYRSVRGPHRLKRPFQPLDDVGF
jgi:hypothetical protein